MKKIKYCALTTISSSLKSFVLPSLHNLKKYGYKITVSCANDDEFAKMIKDDFSYFPLDIARGFNLSKTIKNVFVLYRFFKNESFQMIEYGTENIALCASIAGFFAGVPVRIYNHWGARFVGLDGISRILSILIERIAAGFSTDVRQVSYRNAQMCIDNHIYPAEKVKVLGKGGTIGVDFSQFDCQKKMKYREEILLQYQIQGNAFIYGFVGRIQKDKGINELIDAFKTIYDNNEHAYLMLVGPIDTENPIDAEKLTWAQKCSRVIFTDYVKDTYRYMSAFDVMVHPTYREGFGMVLQEAAAVKTMIITTDIMGPGEFINNGISGITVQPKNSKALHEAMRTVINNGGLRKQYVDNCYQYTRENFERTIMLEQIRKDRETLERKIDRI